MLHKPRTVHHLMTTIYKNSSTSIDTGDLYKNIQKRQNVKTVHLFYFFGDIIWPVSLQYNNI